MSQEDKDKEIEEAIAAYSKAIELSSNPWNYKLRGHAYYKKGEYDKAIDDYTKAMIFLADGGDYFDRAEAYYKKGEYDKAIDDYTEAIRRTWQRDGTFDFYYRSRGQVYFQKGEYDKAIDDYSELIKNSPRDSWYYKERGDSYYKKGEIDKAIADYDKSIELLENFKVADFYNSRGEAYFSKGMFDKAIIDFNEAVKLDPNNTEFSKNLEKAQCDKKERERKQRVAKAIEAGKRAYHEKKKLVQKIRDEVMSKREVELRKIFETEQKLPELDLSKIEINCGFCFVGSSPQKLESIIDRIAQIERKTDFFRKRGIEREQKCIVNGAAYGRKALQLMIEEIALWHGCFLPEDQAIIFLNFFEDLFLDEYLSTGENDVRGLLSRIVLMVDRYFHELELSQETFDFRYSVESLHQEFSEKKLSEKYNKESFHQSLRGLAQRISEAVMFSASKILEQDLRVVDEEIKDTISNGLTLDKIYHIASKIRNYFIKRRISSEEKPFDNPSQRHNLRIVGGTEVESQSLTQSEKARAAIALTKLRRAQEELKSIAEVTTDATLLYDLWSGKTGLDPSIFTEQLGVIFSFIPEGSIVRFNKKTNSAGTKYLTVKWESDNEIDKGEITLGTYQEDGTLVWSDPSTWVQREKQKNKQGYIQKK